MTAYQEAAILFLLFALGAAVVVALLLYEAWTLLDGKPPITWFVRLGIHDHHVVTFVVAVMLGLLLGHFLWP